jgi:hypothetical protein
MRSSRSARNRWSWLLLPIRFGEPVVRSPGATLLKQYDVGQSAPLGPAFNLAWNRVGATAGYERYHVYQLSKVLQRSPWDLIVGELGFLNVLGPIPLSLPGLNIAATYAAPFVGGFGSVVFTQRPPPRRSLDFAFGGEKRSGGHRWALPRVKKGQPTVRENLAAVTGRTDFREDFRRDAGQSLRATYMLHWGQQWGTETEINVYRDPVVYRVIDPTQAMQTVALNGSVRVIELAGFFRLNTRYPFRDRLEFVPRIGYGWTFYRVSGNRFGAIVDSVSRTIADLDSGGWVGGILPNTFLIGGMLEVTLPVGSGVWPLFRNLGLRLGYTKRHTRDVGWRSDWGLSLWFGV